MYKFFKNVSMLWRREQTILFNFIVINSIYYYVLLLYLDRLVNNNAGGSSFN